MTETRPVIRGTGMAGHSTPHITPHPMQEKFLHFVWRTGRFDQQQLQTTSGESLTILRRGHYHGHAGPDFNGAHIRIGHTIWHGQVEMHLFASEWYRHKHHEDPNYDGTILHVVWEEDQPVFRRDGTRVPCLELKRRVDRPLLARYERLIHDGNGIPCKFALPELDAITKRSMLDRALIERLDRRADDILHTFTQQHNDWQETAWLHLAAGLGLPINQEPMLQVARTLPLRFLQRYAAHPLQVEALVFGQAGLLQQDWQDAYPRRLSQEYRFLQHKHPELTPIPPERWKYLRMRPVAFPNLRLARLAAMALRQENALGNLLSAQTPMEWLNSLDGLVHPYWTKHYRFDLASPALIKHLGRDASHSLVINVASPLLYAYGRQRGESRWQEKALDFLSRIPAERNAIIAKWLPLNMPLTCAAESQAILELQKMYCAPRRCLDCAIGCRLVAEIRKGEPLRVEEVLMEFSM